LKEYEYMKMYIGLFPIEFIKLYKLQDLVDDQGFVYMEIRGSMYGLP